MSTNEIISSGILEAYVMRVATPEEVRLIEDNLSDPTIQQELREIEDALADISLKLDKPVPASVKANLDQLLFGDTAEQTIPTPTAEVKPVTQTQAEPKVIEMKPKNQAFRWMAAAASIALVASVGLNLFQFMNYQEIKNKMASLESTNNALIGEVKVVREDLTFIGAVADFFQQGDVRSVELDAVPNRSGKAMLYCDLKSGKVAIKSSELPAIGNEYQYQLWALVDGTPVDMGMIPNGAVGKDELTMLKSVKGMQAYAITKEVYGGKPTPNLAELVVMGKAV